MTSSISRSVLVLAALGATLWSTAAAANQAAPAGPLAAPLRAHVRDARFNVITSVRGLPLGVREAMQALWKSATLDIAEPGTAFQASGPTRSQLASRRLALAACSNEHYCLVYYERGGSARTWHVLLYHWTPAATRLELAGGAPAGLKTIEDVRKLVLSGAITHHDGPW